MYHISISNFKIIEKFNMYKKSSVALAIASLMLFGCGGSDSSNDSQSTQTYQSESTSSLTDYIDVRMSFNNPWKETIGHSYLGVDFEPTSLGLGDKDQFSIGAANLSENESLTSWENGADFVIYYHKGGQNYVIHSNASFFEEEDEGTIFSKDLGGVWSYKKSVSGQTPERSLILRVNRNFSIEGNISSEELEIVNELKRILKSINLSTPMKAYAVHDKDNLDTAPDGGFSQKVDGKIDDNPNDYTGTEQWVDISSVQLSLSPQ
ncbi:hypothetical protein GCM10007938_37940 [Vibrio zhanjiangensis]|uniref:Uncharacterized protein n=1 Tax=Vibrio zhanjiangensis TaxID=1046128 RepID=A0ABQ6F5B2_9VIBR|nr:hypothetical protein [Vibrio zhanjiangensis]GLT20011.1 hypothetical protein GCM10007938_37940 [Vibrio zhanjiangensis]